jgi:hypothetical protein
MGMLGQWADDFERHRPWPACVRGAHDDCPHLLDWAGRFNPRRLRLEFGGVLCTCECHSSCPVTGNRIAVREQSWREWCTCPGAEAGRIRLDEEKVQARQYFRACEEAFEAARARAAGMSREQARDLYAAELRSRGLEVPAEPFLDAYGSLLADGHHFAARYLARSLAILAKLFTGISDIHVD